MSPKTLLLVVTATPAPIEPKIQYGSSLPSQSIPVSSVQWKLVALIENGSVFTSPGASGCTARSSSLACDATTLGRGRRKSARATAPLCTPTTSMSVAFGMVRIDCWISGRSAARSVLV